MSVNKKQQIKVPFKACSTVIPILSLLSNGQFPIHVPGRVIIYSFGWCYVGARMKHWCIRPTWSHRRKPSGFLYNCECVKTWCISRSIIMCTVCSLKRAMLKCIIVKKNWYHDHWCVLSRSLEMLWASAFHFISSLLLLECHLQVKCKQFLHSIQQNIWYEICPKWKQKQLIIWTTACDGCSLAFFCITEQLYQYLDTTEWESPVSMSSLNSRLGWWLKIKVIY